LFEVVMCRAMRAKIIAVRGLGAEPMLAREFENPISVERSYAPAALLIHASN